MHLIKRMHTLAVTAALLREAEAAVKPGVSRTMKTDQYTFKDKMML